MKERLRLAGAVGEGEREREQEGEKAMGGVEFLSAGSFQKPIHVEPPGTIQYNQCTTFRPPPHKNFDSMTVRHGKSGEDDRKKLSRGVGDGWMMEDGTMDDGATGRKRQCIFKE